MCLAFDLNTLFELKYVFSLSQPRNFYVYLLVNLRAFGFSDLKKLSCMEEVHFYCKSCSSKLTKGLR